jgi:hypothetical protein
MRRVSHGVDVANADDLFCCAGESEPTVQARANIEHVALRQNCDINQNTAYVLAGTANVAADKKIASSKHAPITLCQPFVDGESVRTNPNGRTIFSNKRCKDASQTNVSTNLLHFKCHGQFAGGLCSLRCKRT